MILVNIQFGQLFLQNRSDIVIISRFLKMTVELIILNYRPEDFFIEHLVAAYDIMKDFTVHIFPGYPENKPVQKFGNEPDFIVVIP